MKIYLIRHASTELNVGRRFQGLIDLELSPTGLFQADQLGKRFKNIHLDKLYSSPLKRAIQTANGIQKYTEKSIIINNNLREIDFGEWDGAFHSDLEKKYGCDFTNFYYHPSEYPFPGEGNLQNVRNRISIALNSILKENSEDSSIAIVSHGGTLRVIFLYLLQMNLAFYRNLMFDNTSVSLLEYRNGEFFIHTLNDTHHLDSHFPDEEW